MTKFDNEVLIRNWIELDNATMCYNRNMTENNKNLVAKANCLSILSFDNVREDVLVV